MYVPLNISFIKGNQRHHKKCNYLCEIHVLISRYSSLRLYLLQFAVLDFGEEAATIHFVCDTNRRYFTVHFIVSLNGYG